VDRVLSSVQEFLVLGAIFAAIAIWQFGLENLQPTERQKRNWRLNLAYFAADILVFLPVIVWMAGGLRNGLGSVPIGLEFQKSLTQTLSPSLVLLLAIAVADFVGYWRHRLMHTRPLWPVHAAHHSDEDLTWFSLVRFHPFNRVISVFFDIALMSLLGFPVWAIVLSNRFRHYYGYFVHASFGWRFGPLRFIFVSPFFHRWHHAQDMDARDKNFATVFSLYDLVFGTFYCPKKSAENLGVDGEDYPASYIGQLFYPLKQWKCQLQSLVRRPAQRGAAPTK
jgi:sterol desaturase/sphingolipid hydroxylase (fatty acid hydroxylase superfamily)